MCMFFQQLDQEAQRLTGEQPSSRELIDEKQTEITENWEQLTQRADERSARNPCTLMVKYLITRNYICAQIEQCFHSLYVQRIIHIFVINALLLRVY